MSNHQKGASIADFVGPLLKRLKQAKERVPENSETETIIDEISIVVEEIKDMIDSREKLDKLIIGYLGKIERKIDSLIDCEPLVKASDSPQKAIIIEGGQSSNQSYQMNEGPRFQELIDSVGEWPRKLLMMLAIFPENEELKKRFLIYWWSNYSWNNRDYCERIISDLVNENALIPVHREHNNVIDRVTIKPMLREWLISNRERYGKALFERREEGSWCFYKGILLNIDQRYLDSKDIIYTMKKHDVYVVQLGSWRCTTNVYGGVKETGSKETKLKDHIEVDQTDFLKKLEDRRTYLSLRGISGITELPESIGKLEWLVILDLRACHNLEKLPQKSRSGSEPEGKWFENLEILDISECYLLDHMPKWICELSTLVVLKGFVVGNLGNKNQSCSLADLSKLKKLQKLSIRFTIDILGPEVFSGFNSLDNLLVLTLIWRQNKKIPTYYLPKNIEKLDIRCYPEDVLLSKLQNPEQLTKLKRLYIRGGNLTKIPCHDNWNVKILRLRFLNKLVYPTDWKELKNSFNIYIYIERERERRDQVTTILSYNKVTTTVFFFIFKIQIVNPNCSI